MRRGVHFGLIAGCLVVLALEAPAAIDALNEGLRGPYEVRAAEAVPPACPEPGACDARGPASVPVPACHPGTAGGAPPEAVPPSERVRSCRPAPACEPDASARP